MEATRSRTRRRALERARGRRDRGHEGRGARPVLQHAGAAALPQDQGRPSSRACSTSCSASRSRTSASASACTHDGRRVFDVEPGMDLRARVRRIFGAELAEALVAGRARATATRVLEGLLAPPRFARGDGTRQMWFLNGRPLRDKVLARCLKEAYRGFLVDGRQPVAFLALGMDPRARRRQRAPGEGRGALPRAAARVRLPAQGARRGRARAPTWPRRGERLLGDRRAPRQKRPPRPSSSRRPGRRQAPPRRARARARSSTARGGAAELAERPRAPGELAPEAPPGRFAGPFLQVARTYLVRALDDGFEIVDQHALHERVTFEELQGASSPPARSRCSACSCPSRSRSARRGARLLEAHRASAGGHRHPPGPLRAERTVAVARPAGAPGGPRTSRSSCAWRSRSSSAPASVPPAGELLEELLHRRGLPRLGHGRRRARAGRDPRTARARGGASPATRPARTRARRACASRSRTSRRPSTGAEPAGSGAQSSCSAGRRKSAGESAGRSVPPLMYRSKLARRRSKLQGEVERSGP